MGPLRLKNDPCINGLFSMNFGIVRIQLNRKWAPRIGEGGEVSPLSPPPPGCAIDYLPRKLHDAFNNEQRSPFIGVVYHDAKCLRFCEQVSSWVTERSWQSADDTVT